MREYAASKVNPLISIANAFQTPNNMMLGIRPFFFGLFDRLFFKQYTPKTSGKGRMYSDYLTMHQLPLDRREIRTILLFQFNSYPIRHRCRYCRYHPLPAAFPFSHHHHHLPLSHPAMFAKAENNIGPAIYLYLY